MTLANSSESELEQILPHAKFRIVNSSLSIPSQPSLSFPAQGYIARVKFLSEVNPCNFHPSPQRRSAVFPGPLGSHRPTGAGRFSGWKARRLKEAQDDATALSIRTQERIGLDLLSDGEQRRTGFINHILAAFEGIDLKHEAVKQIYRRREQPRPVPRIVGKIKRRAPAIVDDLRFAKAQTDKPIKMDVPGPMTVIDSTLDEFYKDEATMAMDVAAALNEELRDLQAAGCDVLEIDEPAMTRYHEKVFAYGAKALDRCLEGINIPTVVHLCYGYPGGAGHATRIRVPGTPRRVDENQDRRLRRRVHAQQLRPRGVGCSQR